jgi:ABC-type hemin transport system substrate-binding protein
MVKKRSKKETKGLKLQTSSRNKMKKKEKKKKKKNEEKPQVVFLHSDSDLKNIIFNLNH